ncbi:hypothetical protein JST97_03830 [bacterium]|nr:hypothetical protein [bacterium]
MKLQDKVRKAIQNTLGGGQTRQQLIEALEREMEILRAHHAGAPQSELGNKWREALEVYFEALEYAIELAEDERLQEREELTNVYGLCAEADELMNEIERSASDGLIN